MPDFACICGFWEKRGAGEIAKSRKSKKIFLGPWTAYVQPPVVDDGGMIIELRNAECGKAKLETRFDAGARALPKSPKSGGKGPECDAT